MEVLVVEDCSPATERLPEMVRAAVGADAVMHMATGLDAGVTLARRCADIELVVVDAADPVASEFMALTQLRAENQDATVVVFGGDEDRNAIRAWLNAGASAYISKNSAPSAAAAALRFLAHGRPFR